MSWLLISSSALFRLLLHCSILVQLGTAIDPIYFCSRDIYDNPALQDCSQALAALPRVDGFWRYHVEPQLEVAPPEYDWLGWADRRPASFRQKIAQIPKFWSTGKQVYFDLPIHQYIVKCILDMMKNDLERAPGSCNIALTSYVEGSYRRAISIARWSDIYLAGYYLVQVCVHLHSQGGAATVKGKSLSTLTVLLRNTLTQTTRRRC